jgi:hypothetical protein
MGLKNVNDFHDDESTMQLKVLQGELQWRIFF